MSIALQTSQSAETYNYKVVKQFSIMTIVWGVVGMLLGVIIAAQMAFPELNFGPYFHFGRLRPLHTNAVIFAFGGCALFATSYYVVQRTTQARLAFGRLASFTFWGWQAVIVAAVITLPLGLTAGKEYAELIWPIDSSGCLPWTRGCSINAVLFTFYLGSGFSTQEEKSYFQTYF
mgnify:CR=1 FL=1